MSEIIQEKKRMLSGIKPSGDLTLGSYLGAVKNWAERADDYDCFYFMADLHAITVRQNPADLRRRTLEQLAQYIACGLDPEKNVLFIQSHVHQHAELGWVLKPAFWHKGYADEMTDLLTALARREGKNAVIECVPEQTASAHIARRHGFSYEGRADSCDVYRLRCEK